MIMTMWRRRRRRRSFRILLQYAFYHTINQTRKYTFTQIQEKSLEDTIALCLSRNPYKGLKRVTHVHSVGIFSFAKYHIWNHEDFVRVCFIRVTTHAMTFCFYASYLSSDFNAETFVQKLKRKENKKNLTKVNIIFLSLVKNKTTPACAH